LNNFQRVPYDPALAAQHAENFAIRQNNIPYLHTDDHVGEVRVEGIGEQAFVAEMNALTPK
jgi:hypothetical protein